VQEEITFFLMNTEMAC